MNNLFRFLFLVKEIKSKTGELHFQRWRILWTPWFTIYIHRILKSDEDKHPHSHPWNFLSFILSGSYNEELWYFGEKHNSRGYYSSGTYTWCNTLYRKKEWYHKISLNKPTTTIVFVGKRDETFYYLVNGEMIEQSEYRKNKNLGLYE